MGDAEKLKRMLEEQSLEHAKRVDQLKGENILLSHKLTEVLGINAEALYALLDALKDSDG